MPPLVLKGSVSKRKIIFSIKKMNLSFAGAMEYVNNVVAESFPDVVWNWIEFIVDYLLEEKLGTLLLHSKMLSFSGKKRGKSRNE